MGNYLPSHVYQPSALIGACWRTLAAWFTPSVSRLPFVCLRIGLACILIVQALMIAPHLQDLYGPQGLFQGPVSEVFLRTSTPEFISLPVLGNLTGLAPSTLLTTVFGVYLCFLILTLSGWWQRVVLPVTWLLHGLLMFNWGMLSSYGVDTFVSIIFFYLTLSPKASLRRRTEDDTETAKQRGFCLRIMQLHLMLVYFSSGIYKSMGGQWWNGEVIWRAMMMPGFGVFNAAWLSKLPWFTVALSLGTLLIETGYPLWVMGPATVRRLVIASIISMHIGIAIFLGLWTFSAVMVLLNLSLFVVPFETGRLRASSARAYLQIDAVPVG